MAEFLTFVGEFLNAESGKGTDADRRLLVVAQNGHAAVVAGCPLLGVKRTSRS
jgi:hypothetical protein